MKKSVAGFFIIMLVVAWMLSGCGHSSSPAGASGGETKEPIKIGFSALPTWYMWYLVEEKGFFEKHGVDVELVYFPVYGDSVSALSTGEVDGNSQTLLDSMAPLSNGISLKAVLVTDNSHGGDGLVAASGIQSVEDLQGKRVATEIGTIAHFFLLTVLNEAGMTEADVNFTNMTVSDAGASFIAGKLDAAELWEPFLSKAVNEGKGKLLVSSADYPGLIADLLVMREEVTEERPEDVQKIVSAWFDAVAFYKENPEEAIGIMAEKAGISEEEMKLGLEGFRLFSLQKNLSAYTDGETYESLFFTGQKNGEFLQKQGFIDEIPDLTSLLDPAFVQKEAENR